MKERDGCSVTNIANQIVRVSRQICNKSVFAAIGLGQLLSLLICGTAVTSGLLQQQSVNIPTAQSFLNYVLLCAVYTSWLACRPADSGLKQAIRQCGWKYFLLAFIDVEANYLVIKAYNYTTVTSVQLLDCIAIPTVLVLSRFLLRVRYRWQQFVGVAICLVGVGVLVLADCLAEQYSHGGGNNNKLIGDLLVIAGAVLYGVSNVGQEWMVVCHGNVEYLGSIGMFGSIINGVQLAVLERFEIASVNFASVHVVLPFLLFAVCLFLLYTLMPVAMARTGAMAVNLNLLSSDFYAILLGLYVFYYKFHWLYIISIVTIVIGIITYSVYPPWDSAAVVDGQRRTSISDMSLTDREPQSSLADNDSTAIMISNGTS